MKISQFLRSLSSLQWDILETLVMNPPIKDQRFWCEDLVGLGLLLPDGDDDFKPSEAGRRIVLAFRSLWDAPETSEMEPIDYARDPMFASLGDCQSPSVKRLREED